MPIPGSELERQICELTSTSISQNRFLLCLLAAVPLSWLQRQIQSVTWTHVYAIVSGLLLIYLPFGDDIWTLFPSLILSFAAIKYFPSKAAWVVWLTVFPHLIYQHFINASGMAWKEGEMDATGAFMVMFLKVAATAHCRQDGILAKDEREKKLNAYQRQKLIEAAPTLLEFFSYIFCFGHLLAGPFCEFKDYKDFVERKGVWSGKLRSRWVPTLMRIVEGLTSLGIYLAVSGQYPPSFYFSETFKAAGFPQRIWYAYMIAASYRLQYYLAWKLAESAGIASGFGFNPSKGPDGKEQIKWDRCKNVEILKSEFPQSLAKLPLFWNMCTSMFLRRYVYERLTPVNGKPTFTALMLTQLVSAIWHGVYPGYIITFASAAVSIEASRRVYRLEKDSKYATLLPYRILKILHAILTETYMVAPFMILEWKGSIEALSSMMFISHFIDIATFILVPIISKAKQKTA